VRNDLSDQIEINVAGRCVGFQRQSPWLRVGAEYSSWRALVEQIHQSGLT
jgi:hypothetical protein